VPTNTSLPLVTTAQDGPSLSDVGDFCLRYGTSISPRLTFAQNARFALSLPHRNG